jgi:hypothetical protein
MPDALIHIPDALPVLSRGNHQPGSGKACVMDAISIISGNPAEQDHPSCVHPMLRGLFIRLNDTAADDQRHRLWEPALRAMGTGVDEDLPDGETERLVAALLLAQTRRALAGQRVADHPAAVLIRPLLTWQAEPCYRTRRVLNVARAAAQTRAGAGKHDCRGCALLTVAARPGSTWGTGWAYAGLTTWDDKLAALGSILDDWLTMLPARDQDAPVDVPWSTLRDELGVVIPDHPGGLDTAAAVT